MKLSRPTGSDALTLLRMKSGANYLGMSYSMRYFSGLISAYGRDITYFAGEGGDKVLPDIRPARNFTSLRSLALFLIEENRIMPVETVSRITSVPEEEIVSSVISALDSYPEEDLRLKYVRFMLFERSLAWLSEGEDRNRSFFNTASPLLSTGFLEFAMSCPWKAKIRYRLYRNFLGRLSEAASNIEISGWGSSPSSIRSGIYLLGKDIYRRLPSGARTAVRRRMKKNFTSIGAYAADSPTYRCLMEQIDSCGAVAGYLAVDEVRERAGDLNKMGFDHLLTVTSAIEQAATGSSTIEKYLYEPLL
jgi:asparagine synthase (glutamine-hydrolysing)